MLYEDRNRRTIDFEFERSKTGLSSIDEITATQLRVEMRTELAKIRLEMGHKEIDLLKWMFGSFWFATMMSLFALMFAVAGRR